MRSTSGHKFSGDEVLLVGLYRMHRPTCLADACWKELFGMNYSRVSTCFRLFITHLCRNWQYLLTDNLDFWRPYLPHCAEAIRRKMGSLGCEFPQVNQPCGFRVFGFIDNTMFGTCRPGGGPSRDGPNAPRNDPLIQRAWYNGWKKIHGLKFQTVDLPNGMCFHVFGPVSLRHNDLYTLFHSNINDLVAGVQIGDLLQFVIYGDSAYVPVMGTHIKARHNNNPNNPRQILENASMVSCREAVEWDYGDAVTAFAMIDFNKGLKMRGMPVGNMCMGAMLLRNAYVTMNSCNAGHFFDLEPPTFEEWVANGPRVV